MTSDENASLANERRKNGRAKPWQLKYLGIGNETWGCGGNMSGDYAAEVNARYSTFVNAPAAMGMIKVASGATGNERRSRSLHRRHDEGRRPAAGAELSLLRHADGPQPRRARPPVFRKRNGRTS